MSIIPKEKIKSCERWNIASFDGPAKPIAKLQNPPVEIDNHDSGTPVDEIIALPTAESVERIHEEAHKEGYAEGYASGEKAGLKAGSNDAQQQADRLAQLANNFEKALTSLDQGIADAVLELSVSIAQQIVQHQMQTQPEFIIEVIRSALTSLPLHHGNINISVHPDDAHLLREHLGNQINQLGWHLVDAPNIERGGCLIRAGSSEIDATFATRWRRVLEALGKPLDSDK